MGKNLDSSGNRVNVGNFDADGLNVNNNWDDSQSYLNDNWYNPANQWNVGNVFPVASSIIFGDLFASRPIVYRFRGAAG